MQIAHYTFESLLPESASPSLQLAAQTSSLEAATETLPPPPPPSYSEADLELAKRAAYEEGFMAGKAEGKRETDHEQLQLQQEMNQIYTTVASHLTQLTEEHRSYLTARQPELGRLVLSCAQKLAVEALRKEPLADIEAMIRDCLGLLLENPEVLIYVNPRLQAPLAKKFNGQVKVIANPEMNPIDCRITWQYGEASREIDPIWAKIEETIDRYFTITANEMKTHTNIALSEGGQHG